MGGGVIFKLRGRLAERLVEIMGRGHSCPLFWMFVFFHGERNVHAPIEYLFWDGLGKKVVCGGGVGLACGA